MGERSIVLDEDIIGHQFGELTVLRRDDEKMDRIKATSKNGKSDVHYICKCSCGAVESFTKHTVLHSKNPKCKRHEGRILIGKTLGEYTVLDVDEEKTLERKALHLKCRCSCGTINSISLNNFKQGSCTQCHNHTYNIRYNTAIENIGNSFNSWAIKEVYTKEQALEKGLNVNFVWCLCECICGTIRPVKFHELENEESKSCGSCKSNQMIGKVFQEWTVIDRHETNKKLWKCRCSCGTIAYVSYSNLVLGKSNACKLHDSIFQIGKKFGRLTVEDVFAKDNVTYAKCLCDCGNQTVVAMGGLKNGTAQSCGCLASELARERLKKYNTWDFKDNYVVGYTQKGECFFVSNEDYDKVKEYCWHINSFGYVQAKVPDGSGKHVLLHRLLFDLPQSNIQIDHINGLPQDNRICNLRTVNNSGNQMNKLMRNTISSKSKVAGVSWHKRDKIWEVNIKDKNYKAIYLGRYENLDEAIAVRKKYERELYGEYSYESSQKISKENGVDEILQIIEDNIKQIKNEEGE